MSSKPKIPRSDSKNDQRQSFPIVGIGASAGGLEALEKFLANVPEKSGMAFVIVQHLDPNYKGIMVELLQRVTPMKVAQSRDRMKIEPDCVYVIPPNKDLSIMNGALYLMDLPLPLPLPHSLRLPIDFFFRSLAEDQKERSIGVILSGMGTDGTLGLRSIKEKAGVALVQDPLDAKFDSMPRSVIDAGIADIVAPAADLPQKILAILQYLLPVRSSPGLEPKSQTALEKALVLVRAQTGQDFSGYKKSTIYRRIERRMSLHQIDKIAVYVRYLQTNPQELTLLYKELLIGVTHFFRDIEMWDHLKDAVIARYLADAHPDAALRAWTAGCSTGEEAYSLAILISEVVEDMGLLNQLSIQIFATDLDQDAIAIARKGQYPENIAATVTPERLAKYFVREEKSYRISKDIREKVIFAPHNVIADPPFTRLDFLVCRNLLIYLESTLQKKLLALFHYSLKPGGILFLGNSETIGETSDLFVPLYKPARIYRSIAPTGIIEPLDFPSRIQAASSAVQQESIDMNPSPNIQSLADQIILQRYSPPAVLVNGQGDILYINGRTGKYLEPAAGKANWNIFAMARAGLSYALMEVFQTAVRSKSETTRSNVQFDSDGTPLVVNITVNPIIEKSEALQGMALILFEDAPALPNPNALKPRSRAAGLKNERIQQLEQELQQAREDLQSFHEEMQTSKEELNSINEELQSTNEELQSTNEELTTSKEEMQSLNEELHTVNAELQVKVDDLSKANDDMKNLLDSTEIATVFLDRELCIRRFTSQSTQIVKLIPADIGRHFTDIVSDLDYPNITEDVQEVLRTLVFSEREIPAKDSRWFRVRIMPYRTLDNHIDGLVITFMDISALKKLEAELRAIVVDQEHLLDLLPVGVMLLDRAGEATRVNQAFERIGSLSRERWQGLRYLQIKFLRPDNTPLPTNELPWMRVIRGETSVQAEKIGWMAESGDPVWVLVNAYPGASSTSGALVIVTPGTANE